MLLSIWLVREQQLGSNVLCCLVSIMRSHFNFISFPHFTKKVWVHNFIVLSQFILQCGRLIFLTFSSRLGSPRFGIAHALCLGLAPWLAAEIPVLVDSGMIKHKDDAASASES